MAESGAGLRKLGPCLLKSATSNWPCVHAVKSAPELKGLDLVDGLHDLDANKDVNTQLQPPPHTLADLEAILERPEFLPTGCGATRTAGLLQSARLDAQCQA